MNKLFLICPLGAAVAMASIAIARKATCDTGQRVPLADVIFGCVLTSVREAVDSPKEAST